MADVVCRLERESWVPRLLTPPPPMAAAAAMETTFTQSEKEENVISLTLGFFDKDIFDVLHFKQVFFNSHK